jgi:hypothetical protein
MKNHITVLKECKNYRITWENESLFMEDRALLEALKAFSGQTEFAYIVALYGDMSIEQFMSRVITETWYEIKELHEKSGFIVTTEAIDQ